MIEAIQIKINLEYTNPLIWRQILLPRDISFYKLHHSIQLAMDWTNSHLFEFKMEGYRVGEIFTDFDEMDEADIIDAKKTKLTDLINNENESLNYTYDFGDSWDHTIIFEKIVMLEDDHQMPFCIAGALKCPPEDCGGIPGFYNFLNILSDKHHEEYKETKIWAGGKFNVNEFDLLKINKQLKKIDKYIKSIDK